MLYSSISIVNHKLQCPVKTCSAKVMEQHCCPPYCACATATTSNHMFHWSPADFNWASSKHTHTHTCFFRSQQASTGQTQPHIITCFIGGKSNHIQPHASCGTQQTSIGAATSNHHCLHCCSATRCQHRCPQNCSASRSHHH